MLDPVRAKARVIAYTAAAFAGGVLLASGMEWTAGSYASTALLQAGTPSVSEVRPVAELSEAFVAISESVTPAVVNVRTEQMRRVPTARVPEPLREFFRVPPGSGGGEAVPMQGEGTGFLISEDGYIMTNNHVVEGADRITVILQDRREFDATVVGRDPTTDVAMIKIDGTDLPSVRLGDPEGTRVGEWVLAIGNPLGLDFTVTAGIVSAKGRGLPIIRTTLQQQGFEQPAQAIEAFIQTDAAINRGNSGGPLVNLRGEVIGVNSAIASETGLSEGYGFAIPIDLASRVADDLIRYGRVRRAMLGVTITPVTAEDREVYGLPAISGAVIQDFSTENSPAAEAGLQREDVIVAVDGKPISESNQLQRTIASRRPGDRVRVDVIRYGDRKQFVVQLGEAPAPTAPVTESVVAEPTATSGSLGVQVAPITGPLAEQLGFDRAGGVYISSMDRYGALGRLGADYRGFKVARVDRQAIETAEDFERIVRAKSPGQVVSLELHSPAGLRTTVNVRIPR
jgi:serine protease Do